MEIRTILFLIISIIPFTCLAQKSKQAKAIKKVEPIETEDENHPPMGSPIVRLSHMTLLTQNVQHNLSLSIISTFPSIERLPICNLS